MPYECPSDSRSELDRLMEQYGSSLLRMSALYLKDASLAQDAVQETFLKAYRHLGDYRGESSEKTWLTTICVNTCRDMLRNPWFRHRSRTSLDSLPERDRKRAAVVGRQGSFPLKPGEHDPAGQAEGVVLQ